MSKRKINWNKEITITERINSYDVIGKYAYNHTHQFGGEIMDVNERGITLERTYHPTITGDCVYDSIVINGFKIYDYE